MEEYLVDLNAAQAAIRAGYSKHTAKDIGCQNLAKLNVQTALTAALKARSERTEITQDMVISELAKIAFFDIRKLYDETGNLIAIQKLDADVAAAIGGVDVVASVDNSVTTKLKIIDKKGSLELLGRHLVLFTDKTEVKHSGEVSIREILDTISGNGRKRPSNV